MSGNNLDDFQQQVSQLLIRHRSVLDILSKTQETTARVNRALTKSITECGCVEVSANKQTYDPTASVEENREHLGTHFHGELCEHCHEVLTAEMGKALFYLTSLCNLTDIKLSDVMKTEQTRLQTLGVFNLS
ncbi:DUF1573 domain-containing protein [Brevibacillus dissolubilis]|uniref:DUF1573 domain-containing protein n=1 Tax=Brevibacillus dissolubilis TaxID=1844116 RepID=UPI001116D28D|nr:DUF1573 domain-containing protein [Brevibacillus dissolubilis]